MTPASVIIRNLANLQYAINMVSRIEFGEDNPIQVTIGPLPKEEKNSWPMKKTWRMWMRQTARWMADNGATMPLVLRDGVPVGKRPFNEQDAHELWVSTWLGVDPDGERYKTASGDKGQMLAMMDKHVAWAADRGCKLTIPRDCEYMELCRMQER